MWIIAFRNSFVNIMWFVVCFKFYGCFQFRNSSERFVSVKNLELNHTSFKKTFEIFEISFFFYLNDKEKNFGHFIQSLEFQFECNRSKKIDNELENDHGRDFDKPDVCTNIVTLLHNKDFNECLKFSVQSQNPDNLISRKIYFDFAINESDIFYDGFFDDLTTTKQVSKFYTHPASIVTNFSRNLLSSEFYVFTLVIIKDPLSTNFTQRQIFQNFLQEFNINIQIIFSDVVHSDWTEVNNPTTMNKSYLAFQLHTHYSQDMFILGDFKRPDLSMDVISPFILGSGYGCILKFRTNYRNKADFILKIKVDDLSYTVEVKSFRYKDRPFDQDSINLRSGWENHEIEIGNINSTFQIYIHLHVSFGILAVNQFSFENCDYKVDSERIPCSAEEYQCQTGVCIDRNNVCNLVRDCLFGEDEADELCGFITPEAKCNFDNGSCSMMTVFNNCTADIVEASSVGLISDHTKASDKGKVMSLRRVNCDKGIIQTVSYNQPTKEMQRNKLCKLVLSYLLDSDGHTRLYIRICQNYSCQKTIIRNNDRYIWETFSIPIFNISSSFYIRIRVDFRTGNLFHLDDIFLTKECFDGNITTDIQDAEKINLKIVIIVGFAFGIIIPIFIIVLLVCRKRKWILKFDVNRHLVSHRPVVKDAFVSQIPESLPLIRRLEDAMVETNSTYKIQRDLPSVNYIKNIPRQTLQIKSELGNGAFGDVYQGVMTRQDISVNVAIKRLRTLTSDEAKTDLLFEALTLSQFNHSNIVSCLGISIENGSIMLVLELLEGGDLKKFLRSNRPIKSSSEELHVVDLINLATDIAKGCLYLQSRKFIHRDIAARNCLLTQTGPGRIAKIADFGLAREMILSDYYRKSGHAKLPVRWMPPEAFFDGIFSHKSDVWAYGVLLWEIFSYALLPYPGMSNSEVMVYVHQGKRLSLPEGCPNCIFKVMENCWNLLPEFRPTFEEIVKELKYLNKEFYRNTEDEDITKIHIDDKNICLYENEKPQ